MSGTVTGLDLSAVQAQRAAWAEAVVRGDVECANDYAYRLATAVPSLLAAARHVETVRAAVHLDDDEPISLPAVPGGYKQPFCDGWDAAVDHMRGLVRAALGTEQEGRDE